MDFKNLLQSVFSFSTLVMFLICAIILIFIDCKDYKKKGYSREYKVCRFFGIFFIVFGTSMYIIMKFIIR